MSCFVVGVQWHRKTKVNMCSVPVQHNFQDICNLKHGTPRCGNLTVYSILVLSSNCNGNIFSKEKFFFSNSKINQTSKRNTWQSWLSLAKYKRWQQLQLSSKRHYCVRITEAHRLMRIFISPTISFFSLTMKMKMSKSFLKKKVSLCDRKFHRQYHKVLTDY